MPGELVSSTEIGNGAAGLAPALAAELEPHGGVPSPRSAPDESRVELGARSPPGLLELLCPLKKSRTWEVLKTEKHTQPLLSSNCSHVIGMVQTRGSYQLLDLNVLGSEDVLKTGHFIHRQACEVGIYIL